MYNRYIPQPDGSFRRSRMPDAVVSTPRKVTLPCEEPPPPPPKPQLSPPHHAHRRDQRESNVSGFLRRLIPKDFDTGDLLIIVLLLLMAGDCSDDQNTALLTLALYFLM